MSTLVQVSKDTLISLRLRLGFRRNFLSRMKIQTENFFRSLRLISTRLLFSSTQSHSDSESTSLCSYSLMLHAYIEEAKDTEKVDTKWLADTFLNMILHTSVSLLRQQRMSKLNNLYFQIQKKQSTSLCSYSLMLHAYIEEATRVKVYPS
jgi:hypothetical protein